MFRLTYKILESVVNPWNKKCTIWLDDDGESDQTFDTKKEVREFIEENSNDIGDALFVITKLEKIIYESSSFITATFYESGGSYKDLIAYLEVRECLG